jgi:hypothetical protein
MPMLSDTKVRASKSRDPPYKLSDGKGLYLVVNPSGGRLWRFRYRYAGVERLLAMGKHPDTSLQKAREKRYEAKVIMAGDR